MQENHRRGSRLAPHLLALFLLVQVTAIPSFAQTDEGAIEWRHRNTQHAVTVMANPLGSEARKAFYEGRGFTAAMIQPYVIRCGFSFGMQNDASQAIRVRLDEWRAIGADGKPVSLRLPRAWEIEWEKSGVPQPARIAFHWAQFQAENLFEPGDWIMGMATLEAGPVEPFQLIARYHDNKGVHEVILDKLACSRD